MLSDGALLYGLIALLITVVFVGVFCLLSATIYLSTALSVQETSSGKGELTAAELEAACEPKSLIKTYLLKEIRHVRREPAYLMQGFLMPILYPGIILVLYMFVSSNLSLLHLSNLTNTASALGWMTYVSIMVSFVCTSQNAICTTCMSREGEDIMFLKQTPVDHKVILRSKLYTSLIVSSLGSTTYVIVGGVVLAILGYLPVWMILYGLLVNVCLLFFCVCVRMMGDIKKPSFTWESESQMLEKANGPSALVFALVGILVPYIFTGAINICAELIPGLVYMAAGAVVLIVALMAFFETGHFFKAGLKKMKKY